jgi:hypothetical protein
MQTPSTRKTVNVTLDRELVAWLHDWRTSQTAEVPFGRALDACIRAFQTAQEQPTSGKPSRPRKIPGSPEA